MKTWETIYERGEYDPCMKADRVVLMAIVQSLLNKSGTGAKTFQIMKYYCICMLLESSKKEVAGLS